MPAAPSEQPPVIHAPQAPLTAEQRAHLVAALMDLDEMPKRQRRLLPEYEQECNDAMLAELPKGWRR